MTKAKQLTFPAPRRSSVELPAGEYFTRAWTVGDVLAYKSIGGWFSRTGQHDFADEAARKEALNG